MKSGAMKLIFASNNQHKADEIRAVLKPEISILTLKEAGIEIDIPEPHDTLEENAREKACTIYRMSKMDCFSEDTGLEVLALNGEPGVHSARYAGESRSFEANIEKLLRNLDGIDDRRAVFRSVICLVLRDREYLFEGICKGTIITERKGHKGFGYDPVFLPEGADHTFGEMALQEKTRYSHRTLAVGKLVTFLNNL